MNFLFAFPSGELLGLPIWIYYVFFFCLGSIFGSFLNVVIHRVPLEKSIVFPNSACPKCGNGIKAYDNIPILSWIFLGGKCRNCQNPISARYPAVEALVGIMWAIIFWHDGLTVALPFDLVFVTAIIALIFIDAENMILPDVITKPGIVFALIARLVIPFVMNLPYFDDLKIAPFTALTYPFWLESLMGAGFGMLIGGGSLWLVGWIWQKLRGVEAMGFGDVKMMFAVGAYLGWRLTLLTIFLGAFTGAIAGIIYMRTGKDRDMQTQVPFGIFLGIGAIISLLFGTEIINWYLETFIR